MSSTNTVPAGAAIQGRPRDFIKILIALYFALIISEGALRKWFLPSYSDILYIIRDPLVVWIYCIALMRGIFPARPAIFVLGLIAVFSVLFATISENPLIVTVFGLRTNYLHPPLLFLMGVVLDRRDVIKYCRWVLILSAPIFLLMLQQFQSGSGSILNVGVGGASDSQLTGAMGRVRPSGPFSFVTGIVFFFGLLTAVVCHGWYRPQTHPKWLLIMGTAIVVIAIPVSISRSTLLSVLVVVSFFGLAVLDPRNWSKILYTAIPLILIAVLLFLIRSSDYVEVFTARWVDAANFRGGNFTTNVVFRLLDDYLIPFQVSSEAPFLGHGLGRGTMAGARFVAGERGFLLAEAELGRIVLELGPFLGFGFIIWRFWLAFTLLRHGWTSFRTDGNILPWMMASAAFMGAINAQWGQTTMLGFTVFTCGLCAAALNRPASDSEP